MSNVPAGDPGAFLVPNATAFCEWLVRLAGSIATCVETAEMVVSHVATSGRFPVSAAQDIALAQDLINRGQASANGATNYQAASEQMTRQGIANDAYGADWFAANDFVPVAQAALRRGMAVLFGVYAAFNLHDDWTNSPEDQGVYGHGLALVGMDSTGAIVADPNTSQAESGNFVHYTWADLRNAGGQYPSMVIPKGSLMLDIASVADYFEAQADGSWKCKQTGHVIHMGQLDFYRSQLFCDTGLPLTDEFFPLPGVGAQVFERTIDMYDPPQANGQRKFDNPPGAVGPCYHGHLDDPRLNAVLTGPLAAELADAKNALSQAQATVTADAATIAQLQSQKAVSPQVVNALQVAAQLLQPFGVASADVAAALKEVA